MPIEELHKQKRKKNFTVLAIVFGICVLIWAITVIKIKNAEASEIMHCSDATTYELTLESPIDACDMYTRQLAYREEAIKLRQQIHERSENFAAPSRALRKQYEQDLQALHDSITEDNISSMAP